MRAHFNRFNLRPGKLAINEGNTVKISDTTNQITKVKRTFFHDSPLMAIQYMFLLPLIIIIIIIICYYYYYYILLLLFLIIIISSYYYYYYYYYGCYLLFVFVSVFIGLYSVNRGQRGNSTHFRMEHSALNGSKSEWKMEVKFRPKGGNVAKWQNISVHYPGATTEIDHNFITLTIPWPEEEHEFAVFGTPEKDDKKRMQLGIFGESLAKGKNASFHAVLLDDTLMAFEVRGIKMEFFLLLIQLICNFC